MSLRVLVHTKMTRPPVSTPSCMMALQRKCACEGSSNLTGECEECKDKIILHRKIAGPGVPDAIFPIVHEALQSPGQALDQATLVFMKERFDHDFSRVRVHTNAKAAESAKAVNALAYTVGRDVVFGEGQYAPAKKAGQRLLAHELVHVIQQLAFSPSVANVVGRSDNEHEREPDDLNHDTANANRSLTSIRSSTADQYQEAHDISNGCSVDSSIPVRGQVKTSFDSPQPAYSLSNPFDATEREAETVSRRFLGKAGRLSSEEISSHPSDAVIHRQVMIPFTEEQIGPVREAFEENVKKATRDSCIAIVNKGLRLLFAEQLKGKRLGSEMEKTMAKLVVMQLADRPMEFQFLDNKGRLTKGTLAPETLETSPKAGVLEVAGPETGWYLFGLSIMDGYHSVLLAVDYRDSTAPRIYWMDQIYTGFDDVTETLDTRITRLTKSWWEKVRKEKGVGYNTIVRVWPITERVLGDFPLPKLAPGEALA